MRGKRLKISNKKIIHFTVVLILLFLSVYLCFLTERSSGESSSLIIDAREYSQKSENVLVSNEAPDGSAICLFTENDWIKYDAVDFSTGNMRRMMFIAKVEKGTEVEIRIDQVDGAVIGKIILNKENYGDYFKEYYAKIKSVKGIHDLYVRATSNVSVNLDFIVLSSYTGNENAKEKSERLAWWSEAKYGQFIHWGAYSNFDYPKGFEGYGEWVMNNWKLDKKQYEDFSVASFNPQSFDATKIVQDAQDAGAKYIVFTSKHHDGFSMYDTDIEGFAPYDIMDYGTYVGADILLELKEACDKAGLYFGCYYSILDWHHEQQKNYGEEILDKDKYIEEMKAQIRELIQYYDVDILWFDGGWKQWWLEKDAEKMYEYLRTLKPLLIINDRMKYEMGDYATPEQVIPSEIEDSEWESCVTMNNSWGYVSCDNNWKTPQWIIESLVDVASKGGNLLLNVGPDGNGVVPEECINNLNEAGAWLKRYGESVYGTTESPFETAFDFGTATKKDGFLYLHILNFTENQEIEIPAIQNTIKSVYVLGEDNNENISFSYRGSNITILIPDTLKNDLDTVIVLEVNGTPTIRKNIEAKKILCYYVFLFVLVAVVTFYFCYWRQERSIRGEKIKTREKYWKTSMLRDSKNKMIIILGTACCMLLIGFSVLFVHGNYAYKILRKIGIVEQQQLTVQTSSSDKNQDWAVSAWENCLKQLDYDADVAFLGDSITYNGKFQNYFGENISICNLGLPGDNLDRMTERLSMVTSVSPEKIFVMGGINELKDQEVDNSIKTYAALIDELTSLMPETKIYVQSVLPISYEKEDIYCTNETIEKFNSCLERLAEVHGCMYIDLYSLFEENGCIMERYTMDGIHLTDEAYNVWYEYICDFVMF